ncbi:MAG: GTPase Era [Ruminococcaceae bacterium]|nr:GTPase Era [Oscillospiraceae bacterium]
MRKETNMSEFKSGFVSIVGRPNVGKSTLLNRIIGQKIAIISDKPQTTRNNILGIYHARDLQMVFVDTPGIHRPFTKLGEVMMKSADSAMGDADAVLFLVEPTGGPGRTEEKIMDDLRRRSVPVILVINKIDKVKKDTLLPIIAAYQQAFDFADVFMISARQDDGVTALISALAERMPEGPMYFPEDAVTDQPERQVVAELVREKLLHLLEQEIPHGLAIEVFSMKEKEKLYDIEVNIYCERQSHKGIVIGKNGTVLKEAGSLARADIETMLGKKVLLKIWVKVKEDWRNREGLLRNFGYTAE